MAKKKKQIKKLIEESIEEYLGRGGKITKAAPNEIPEESHMVKSSVVGPPTLYSLDEARHFFSEKRTKVKKEKSDVDFSSIDKSNIPESLHHILEGKNGK